MPVVAEEKTLFGTMLRTLAHSARQRFLLVHHLVARSVSRSADDVILVAPIPPSRFEEVIDKATPFFLGEEGLSRCFPPCATGARARDFRTTARKCLTSGLCALADDPSGNIVGGHFAVPLKRDEVIGVDIQTLAELEDPQEKHILRFLTYIHQRMDLFSVLNVAEIVDMALIFVDKPYRGQGLARRLVMASVKLAAEKGFLAAKGDTTSLVATKFVQGVFSYINSVPFTEYEFEGEAIFGNAVPPDDVIEVAACRLQNKKPHNILLTEFEVNQARRNYLSHSNA